jgi:hypothetical protein
MVAAVRGLSIDELQVIRDGVAAGRKPRVQFTETAGQIAGQVGQVVGLGDPAESDDWLVVRFGKDELPFSPADLQVAPRGAVTRKVPAPASEPAVPARPEPEFVIDKPVPVRPVTPQPVPSQPSPPQAGAAEPVAATGEGAVAPVPRKAAARAAKAKPPATLTVTLAYGDGEWTVAATQGAKVLAKPYVVRPAEAMRMVSLVDVPGVQEAVEQIVSAERADAEQQAQRLRAELAEIEARLAELGEAG